jgi:hypothetical protein
LSDIFKDVQDRVGDFITTGGGEMADFFNEIATKTEGSAAGALKLAKSMRDLSGAEALQLYVNKLKEAGVSQNEMIFYMESMADEATSLIPLLENGGEGFQAWAEAARNAGAIMNDETIAAARQLKIETQLLEMQMSGIKNEFMGGLIPALNQVLSAFTGTSTQALNMRTAGEMLGNTLIGLTKIGMGVAATFDIVGRVVGGAADERFSRIHHFIFSFLTRISPHRDRQVLQYSRYEHRHSIARKINGLAKWFQREFGVLLQFDDFRFADHKRFLST